MLHLYVDLLDNKTTLWERCLNHLRDNALDKTSPLYLKLQEINDNFEDEVWLEMKKSEQLPHIGEVYTSVIADALNFALTKMYPTMRIVIDKDTHDFYMDKEEINSFTDFALFLKIHSRYKQNV